MKIKEIIDGIKKYGIFGFVADNSQELKKDYLKNVKKEIDYTINSLYSTFSKSEGDRIIKKLFENLEKMEA